MPTNPEHVRVRFAPSPTGLLHIGGLRTALTNYLFARHHGGTLILRIEDTDRARFIEEAEADILHSLSWAGITVDESPQRGGPFEPYRQSERSESYARAAAVLVESGHAYLAFDSADEIEQLRQRHRSESNPNPRYDLETRLEMKNSLSLSAEEVSVRLERGDAHVVRLKVEPGQSLAFTDLIRGDVEFQSDTIDDQVLVKSDGLPTYHLANVVDDHAMQITHVIRGEEWLPSTPKHILLYRAFGWTAPVMAHLPLILSPSGGKLSKRSAERAGIPVSVAEYIKSDYEPEAVVNFLALLGWNPGSEKEFFTLEELVEAFSFDRVGQAGIQFDLDKLKWFNEHYLRGKTASELVPRARIELEKVGIQCDNARLEDVIDLMRERISFVKELVNSPYLFADPTDYDARSVSKRWKEDSSKLVTDYADAIAELPEFTVEALEEALRALADENGVGAGRIIHPVRLAVSGISHGPGLFELLHVLGKESCVRRMFTAAEVLGE